MIRVLLSIGVFIGRMWALGRTGWVKGGVSATRVYFMRRVGCLDPMWCEGCFLGVFGVMVGGVVYALGILYLGQGIIPRDMGIDGCRAARLLH